MTLGGTTYTLYTLYRSITPVTFASGATNSPASPLTQNVLYNIANQQGPTGQPIFAYPNTYTVGVIPNVMTVVGTVVINLSVAVNPQALETGSAPEYYTMATQIRPLDLAAAVAINQAGGGCTCPWSPKPCPWLILAATAREERKPSMGAAQGVRTARGNTESGVALILVMLALLVLSTLAGAVIISARSETLASYNYKLNTQADYLAKSRDTGSRELVP